MSTPPRKIHFEFRPGLVWCQADTSGRLVAMSPDPAQVTCKSCRHWLNKHEKQQVEGWEAALRAAVEALP